MGLKINGSTSGSIEIDVPAVAGTDTAITIPAVNGGEFIVSDSSGNVGIGTTSPNRLLTANGIVGVQTSGTEYLRLYGQSGSAIIDSVNSKDLILDANGASNSLVFYQGGAEAARIDSSKRLLVGTSTARTVEYTPGTAGVPKLQIEGNDGGSSQVLITDTRLDGRNPSLAFAKTRNGAIVAANDILGSVSFFGDDGTDTRTWGGRITCEVDGTPGANDMPGRLVFSTTADGASSPTERMRINNVGAVNYYNASSDSIAARSGVSAGTGQYFYLGYNSATSTSNGTYCYGVYTNGDVVNTNNSYGAISDIKLKENIVDAGSQWDDLKAFQVRKYNLKEGQTHTQIGLIAQEVELVSPGLVYESPDRDEDGNDLGTVTKSLNYSVLYMKAVKALQEAMERIEQLESEMAAVKAQLS